MFLFLKSPGVWIFGKTVDSECGAGKYRVEPSEDRSSITLLSTENDVIIWKDRAVTSFKKSNGANYSGFIELQAAYSGFFQTTQAEVTVIGGLTDSQLRASDVPVSNQELMGSWGDRVNPVGIAKFNAPAGYYFYGCTCRIDGSKIASCEKNVNGTVSADATDSFIGVAMYPGEYHPFVNKIVSVTLTNATDQLQYWIKPL